MSRRKNKKAKLLTKGSFRTCAWIFGLALLIRFIFLYEVSKSPTFHYPIIDSGEYERYARMLATGKGMIPEFFWQGFLYPFFLSIIYMICGVSVVCAKIAQAVLGSVVCVLVYSLAKKLFDRRAGILAGGIMAVYGPVVFYDCQLLATSLACFFSVVLMLLFLRVNRESSVKSFVLVGICCGLSIVTRATFLPFVVFALVWTGIYLRREAVGWGDIFRRQLAAVAGLILILLPISVKCYQLTGRFSPLPETGALNLYMGNNSEMKEIMAIRPGSDWAELLLKPRLAGAKNRVEEKQYFTKRIMEYVFNEPGDFAFRMLRKVVQFFTSREIPSNYDLYQYRDYSVLFSVLTWKIAGFGFPFGVLLPLIVIGLVRYYKKLPVAVWLYIVLYPASIILVFITGRYRAAMIPVLVPLAAAGFWVVYDCLRDKRFVRSAGLVGAMLLIAGLSSIAGPFGAEKLNYEVEMHYCLGCEYFRRGELAKSIDFFSRTIELEPEHGEAYRNIGLAYTKMGRFSDAIANYERAVSIDGDYFANHSDLGVALHQYGKIDQAIVHYKKAISLNPIDAEIYFNLGSAFGQKKKTYEAIKYFSKGLELNGSSDSGHYNLGIALSEVGQYRRSLEHLERALYFAQQRNNQAFAMRIKGEIMNIRAKLR